MLLMWMMVCAAQAWADASTQQVWLTDGQSLVGVVEREADGDVVVVLEDGARITIPGVAVASVGAVENLPHPPDANHSRYFYAPTGFPLGKGQGYLAQRALVLSSTGFGVTERWDVELGAVLPTLFLPEGKVGFVGTKVSGSLGDSGRWMLGAQSVVLPDSLPFMFGFAGITLGDEDRHLSVSTGPGVSFERYRRSQSAPMVTQATVEVWVTTVSAVKRLNPRVALVSESWLMILPGGGPWGDVPLFVVPSGGVRLLAPRHAIDLGVVPLLALDRDLPLIPIPWVSFDWTY